MASAIYILDNETREATGEIYFFCSDECAALFKNLSIPHETTFQGESSEFVADARCSRCEVIL